MRCSTNIRIINVIFAILEIFVSFLILVIFDRDAGLSIKAWLDVNDNNHDAVAEVLNAYVGWVQKVQEIRKKNIKASFIHCIRIAIPDKFPGSAEG